MNPKEKAIELVDKFKSKDNAIICVNEIIEATDYTQDYWEEVKIEIESI